MQFAYEENIFSGKNRVDTEVFKGELEGAYKIQ